MSYLEENAAEYPSNLLKVLQENIDQKYDYSESFATLIGGDHKFKKTEVTEDRLMAVMPELKKAIAFYRMYPDIFIDDIKGPNCTFKFYNYQRIFLRAAMRHRKVYATFPRGFSKSFLSMMVLMLRCILYPNVQMFITTGGKEQAASITVAKIEEICKVIPALAHEINWQKGVTTHSKDNVKYQFKSGSTIDILPALERSRGQRRTGGLMEECVLIDPDALNEIIIPTTVINRRLGDGTQRPEEVVNQSQIYITTAGYKDSFAYERLAELFAESILIPDETMILGGTWKIPVAEGLQPKNFIEELKMQGSFNESSFDREYNSKWSGDSEKSYYSSESFDKNRILLQPEQEASGRASKNAYYILGVDVGRTGCNTEVSVVKVTPQAQGSALKSVVNFFPIEGEHLGIQALKLRKLFAKYKAKTMAVDANGLGVGLIDYLVQGQEDPETGDYYPPLGVEDGTFENAIQEYKKFRTDDCIRDALFLIKANAPINTEAHTYMQTQISSGKVKFLITEKDARLKLMETKVGQTMSPEERVEKLLPFQLTDNLKEQMMNLVSDNDGVNVILKQNNRSIPKDRFSSLEYALLYAKRDEDRGKRKRSKKFSEMMFFN